MADGPLNRARTRTSKVNVLVTGANGFVGRALLPILVKRGHAVRAAVRSPQPAIPGCEMVPVADVDSATDWSAALAGAHAVVHLAARVHVMRESTADPLAAFRAVNVDGTRQLAEQSACHGVRRLIFVSSLKALIENGTERAVRSDDPPRPASPYGISKLEAEETLAEVAVSTGLEIVIFRPPLLYGPGVKGNFLSLLSACWRRLPLPIAGISNRRSLLFVGNFADAIECSLGHPNAPGGRFLIQDGLPISTPELVRRVGEALGRHARPFSIPTFAVAAARRIVGVRSRMDRLTESLHIDDSILRQNLGWDPPFTMTDGLDATANWYRSVHAS